MGLLDPATPDTQVSTQDPAGSPPAQDTSPAPDWIQELPEPLRAEKSLHKFKDREAVFASYVELQRKLGTTVQIPKADADAAEWEKLYSRIRPESPEKYVLPADGITDGVKEALRKTAYAQGLNVKQLSEVVAPILAEAKTAREKAQAQIDTEIASATATLKQDFGAEYDANLGLARKALDSLFPGAAAKLIGSGIDNNPDFIKGLVALGKRLGEDSLVSGAGPASAAPKDPYDYMYAKWPKA